MNENYYVNAKIRMSEMPDSCTIKLEIEDEEPQYFDLRTNDNLEYMRKAFDALYRYCIEEKTLDQIDIFGADVINHPQLKSTF